MRSSTRAASARDDRRADSRVLASRHGLSRPSVTALTRYSSLCLLVAAGLTARLVLLRSPIGQLNADEAVVGLMADRMRSTHHVPLFFWGQYYGGTLEPIVVALAFTAARGVAALRVVPLSLSLVGAAIVTTTGRRLFGDMPRVGGGRSRRGVARHAVHLDA